MAGAGKYNHSSASFALSSRFEVMARLQLGGAICTPSLTSTLRSPRFARGKTLQLGQLNQLVAQKIFASHTCQGTSTQMLSW